MSETENPFFKSYREKIKLGDYRLRFTALPASTLAARGTLNRSVDLFALASDYSGLDRLTQSSPKQSPRSSTLNAIKAKLFNGSSAPHVDRLRGFLDAEKAIEDLRSRTSGGRQDPDGTRKWSLPPIPLP